jgi:hypothetical protein
LFSCSVGTFEKEQKEKKREGKNELEKEEKGEAGEQIKRKLQRQREYVYMVKCPITVCKILSYFVKTLKRHNRTSRYILSRNI